MKKTTGEVNIENWEQYENRLSKINERNINLNKKLMSKIKKFINTINKL